MNTHRGTILTRLYCCAALAACMVAAAGFATRCFALDPPPLTPVDEFFILYNHGLPEIPADYRLVVDGEVANPLTLTLEDIVNNYTPVDTMATLACEWNLVAQKKGWIGNALWTGVPLNTIIDEASPLNQDYYIAFHCLDDYVVREQFMYQEELLLAYHMNGESLPVEQGYPLRLIVPGYSGFRWAMWVSRIEITSEVSPEGVGPVPVYSQFFSPKNNATIPRAPYVVTGTAIVGHGREVVKVEVSTDNGTTWNTAELLTEYVPNVWRHWQYVWEPDQVGQYHLITRAEDSEGNQQPRDDWTYGWRTRNAFTITVDYDSDNDTIADAVDNCPAIANADQLDSDNDTAGDVCDNCPFMYNPGQEDSDNDTIGDACDPDNDFDQDGVANSLDNCPYVFNPGQEDSDSDTIGDACDPDLEIAGQISGQLQDGAVVLLYEEEGGDNVLIEQQQTDIQGLFSFSNLPPGNYRVEAVQETCQYSPQYYGAIPVPRTDTDTFVFTEDCGTLPEVVQIINDQCVTCHTGRPDFHETIPFFAESDYKCGGCHVPYPEAHFTEGCTSCHSTPDRTHFFLRDPADQTRLKPGVENSCIACHTTAYSEHGKGFPSLTSTAEIIASARKGTLRQWIQEGGAMAKHLSDNMVAMITDWIDGLAEDRSLGYDPYLDAVPIQTDFDITGVGDNPLWDQAPEHAIALTTAEPFTSTDQVTLKALFSDSYLYVRAEYPDTTLSMTRADSWKYDSSTQTWTHPAAAEDIDVQSEDRLGLLWNMSIPDYKKTYGCAVKCHGSRSGASVFTDGENTRADIWVARAARGLGALSAMQAYPPQVVTDNDRYEVTAGEITMSGFAEDGFLVWYMDLADGYDTATAGNRSDTGMAAYTLNRNDTGTAPRYMEASPETYIDAMVLTQSEIDGGEAIVADADSVDYAGAAEIGAAWDAYTALSSVVPEAIVHEPSESRADIMHAARWKDGVWISEFKRSLTTNSIAEDVQFDPQQEYEFSVAVFDNCGRGEIPPGHTTYGNGQYHILRFQNADAPPRFFWQPWSQAEDPEVWEYLSNDPASPTLVPADRKIMWRFEDDRASCSGPLVHSWQYREPGSQEWTDAAVETALVYVWIQTPAQIMGPGVFECRAVITDCAGQTAYSDTCYVAVE